MRAALVSRRYLSAQSADLLVSQDSYNKNWIFKVRTSVSLANALAPVLTRLPRLPHVQSDNFMFASRWKTLVEQRLRVDAVEVLTWNDYGEVRRASGLLSPPASQPR